jgi:hypothetical protein
MCVCVFMCTAQPKKVKRNFVCLLQTESLSEVGGIWRNQRRRKSQEPLLHLCMCCVCMYVCMSEVLSVINAKAHF